MALDKEKTLDLAQKYSLQGQSKKAIKEYIKLIEADPKDKRVYLKLGDLYYREGENEKAIIEYMKLADLYAEEDLSFRAIAIYKKALAINPKRIDAMQKVAGIYVQEGLRGDAKIFYQNILEIKPDDQEALKALAQLDPQQHQEERSQITTTLELSIPDFPQSISTKPIDDKSDLFPASLVQSETMVESDIFVESDTLLEGPPSPPPDKDSEMHYHLGIAYKEMDLFDYAISEFELASSNLSIKFDCFIMLGNCFMEKGDYRQAIQYFKEASEIKGVTKDKIVRLHFDLANAYEASGMVSEAIETFHLVLKMDRSFREAQERLKRLQQIQG